jgi:hypothetical protein
MTSTPPLESLQKLAASACIDNPAAEDAMLGRADQDELENDIRNALIDASRASIRRSLQMLVGPERHVLIIGLKSKPELNNTRGTVLFRNTGAGRWAVQPSEGSPMLFRTENLLPLLPRQTELELKNNVEATASETQKQALSVFLNGNRRTQAWAIIGSGYRTCPMVIWNRAFEINDCVGHRPLIVRYAGLVQSAISPHGDLRIAQRIANALRRSERVEAPATNDVFDFPEDHEKVESADKPAILWFLLVMRLDLQDWAEALDCLRRIVEDICTGVWPLHYLTEALHFAALIDFSTTHRESCQIMNRLYQEYAHPLDRHRFASELLQL